MQAVIENQYNIFCKGTNLDITGILHPILFQISCAVRLGDGQEEEER